MLNNIHCIESKVDIHIYFLENIIIMYFLLYFNFKYSSMNVQAYVYMYMYAYSSKCVFSVYMCVWICLHMCAFVHMCMSIFASCTNYNLLIVSYQQCTNGKCI